MEMVEVGFSGAEVASLRETLFAAASGVRPDDPTARATSAWLAEEGASTITNATPWAQHDANGYPRRVRWVEESPDDLWIVGDLHGDIISLHASLMAIARVSGPQARIAFLGDYIDRGPCSTAVLLALADRLRAMPDATLLLAGNHDTALRHWAGDDRFDARCAPAEYAAEVSATPSGSWQRELAHGFIRSVAVMPRSVCFRSGLMLAHAGIPQRDLWPARLTSREAFEHPDALRDLVWCRATKARHKDPYRGGHDSEFGLEDFREFCDWMATGPIQWPITTLITGHEHVPERWYRWPRTDPYALWTICGLSWRAGEMIGPYARTPVITRIVDGAPVMHRLALPAALLEDAAVRAIYEVPQQ